MLCSPAGIQSSTDKSTHQQSGEHHAISSGEHSSISAGKSLLVSAQQAIRMFAYKAGIKLISAQKDIDIRALKANIDLLAKMDITATAQGIEIKGTKEVLINGGGSYTRWSAGGIEHGTSGTWVAHAAKHDMVGPRVNQWSCRRCPPVFPKRAAASLCKSGKHPCLSASLF